jgi:hypothetical protein
MFKSQKIGAYVRLIIGLVSIGMALAFGITANAMADDILNWQPVKIGAGGYVTGFVTHPLDATVRYCRTDVGNAYRWSNSTQQWVPMVVFNESGPQGMPASSAPAPASSGVESIAIDPNNTKVVYMAFESGFSSDVASQYTAVKGSVYKSTDGGQTFTGSDLSVDMNPNSNWRGSGERMAVDPTNSSIIYYGSNDNGLWRSTNGGVNWLPVTTGGAPGTSSVILGVRIVKNGGTVSNFGQTVAKTVYALTLNGGVYQSLDGGNTWTDVAAGTGLEGNVSFSTVSPDGSLWVVQNGSAVIWRFASGVWSNYTANFGWGQGVQAIAVDPNDVNRLWVIGQGGALTRTDNLCQTWNACYHNLQFAGNLGWLPQTSGPNGSNGWRSNGGIFYDASGNLWIPEGNEGVLTYTPTNNETDTPAGAPHWTIQSQGIEEFVTHDVIMPPGGNPLVAVEDATGFVVPGLSNFSAFQIPLQNQLISDGTGLAYCPNAPSYVAVATADVNYTSSGLTYSGYSTNGGQTWTPFGSEVLSGTAIAGSIAISCRNGWGLGSDHLVWLPSNGAVPYWSHDGGTTWHASTGFPANDGFWIFALKQRNLKADPFVADKYYCVASWSGGCYVSTDGGQTWTQTSGSQLPAFTSNSDLEVNRAVQNDLWFVDGWAGAASHGLWHSADGGNTFTHSSAFSYAITLALGVGSGKSGDQPYSVYVYGELASNPTWGIFRSNDGGNTWVRVAFYPSGIFDQPTSLAASWDTYGKVILGFGGNSFVYGTENSVDSSLYNFESGTQGWTGASSNCTVATSSSESYLGGQSLAINVNTTGADAAFARVLGGASSPMPLPGQTVNVHFWLPAGIPLSNITLFSQDANWGWSANAVSTFTPGQWNTLTLTIPATAVTPLNAIGVAVNVSGAWSGTYYIDSIIYSGTPLPSAPTGLSATPGNGQAVLNWRATAGLTYDVYRGSASGAEVSTPVATGVASGTYTDTGLTNGNSYYYEVAAVNPGGTSLPSGYAAHAIPVVLGGVDPNIPARTLTFAVTTLPAHGTLTGTAPNLTYTSNSGYSGADSLAFTVTNGVKTSAPATVSVTVNPVAVDVSSKVTVTKGGLRANLTTHVYTQTVTLTNTSSSALAGPLSLVLKNLSSNATLTNGNGTTLLFTPAGRPYINGNALAAKSSETVTLQFSNPTNGGITYTTQVLSGAGSR